MKSIIVAFALISAARAGYISPIAADYNGLGWANTAFSTPLNTYTASVISPVVKNVITATPITPIVKNYVAAPVVTTYAASAPVLTSYAAAPPALATYSAAPVTTYAVAPAVHTYAATPVVSTYGASTIIETGLGSHGWDVDLWKKKKAAH